MLDLEFALFGGNRRPSDGGAPVRACRGVEYSRNMQVGLRRAVEPSLFATALNRHIHHTGKPQGLCFGSREEGVACVTKV